MSKFVFKHIKSVISLAYYPNLSNNFFFRPFSAKSASLKSIDTGLEQSSFTVNYLINQCGLSPKRALSASKYVNFEVANKPNSVLNFFKDHGFTQTQILKIVNSYPRLLVSNPEKTLLPKLEFLRSKGISGSDIVDALSRKPYILHTSLKSIDSSSDRNSFTVDYLISSCGFTPERALAASKYVKFDVASKPDSVITHFKDHGFTQAEIFKLVKLVPTLLISNPEKTLLPKLEFLRSKGISGSDIAAVISRQPRFLLRSLENHLIPLFDLLSDFLQSDAAILAAFKRIIGSRRRQNAKHMEVNTNLLKQNGVPIKNIGYLMLHQPDVLLTYHERFTQIVEEIKSLAFNPAKMSFSLACIALSSMSKSTWGKKTKIYKEWGWSENDIINAFRKDPWCMILSEDKITLGMEFLVNKMGLNSSFLVNSPKVLSLSLEKRIVPRCEFYHILVSKGFLKTSQNSLMTFLVYSEKCFVERFINRHKEEAPELLDLYLSKKKLCLAN